MMRLRRIGPWLPRLLPATLNPEFSPEDHCRSGSDGSEEQPR